MTFTMHQRVKNESQIGKINTTTTAVSLLKIKRNPMKEIGRAKERKMNELAIAFADRNRNGKWKRLTKCSMVAKQ